MVVIDAPCIQTRTQFIIEAKGNSTYSLIFYDIFLKFEISKWRTLKTSTYNVISCFYIFIDKWLICSKHKSKSIPLFRLLLLFFWKNEDSFREICLIVFVGVFLKILKYKFTFVDKTCEECIHTYTLIHNFLHMTFFIF